MNSRSHSLLGLLAFGLLIFVTQDIGNRSTAPSRERATIEPTEALRWSWRPAVSMLTLYFGFGLLLGLLLALSQELGQELGARAANSKPPRSVAASLALGVSTALVPGVWFALVRGLTAGLAEERATPNEGIHRSARHALTLGVLPVVAMTLLIATVLWPLTAQDQSAADWVAFALPIGLLAAGHAGGWAYLRHLTLRALLAYDKAAPWRYVDFLNDATGCLLLRRAGSGYLFVHRLLQEHFAELQLSYRPPGREASQMHQDRRDSSWLPLAPRSVSPRRRRAKSPRR